jgi:acetyl-CoA C-acetyltransferase
MNTKQNRVLVLAYSRTPIGSLTGKLSQVPPEDLGAHAILSVIRRAGIDNLSQIDKVIMGNCVQSYYAPNIARFAALNKAGLPGSIVAYTVHQQCASGHAALFEGWQAIKLGSAKLVIACGTENMAYTPLMVSPAKRFSGFNKFLLKQLKQFKVYGPLPVFGLADSGLGPLSLGSDPSALNMILTAQTVANMCGISRVDADRYALLSQERAAKAIKSGRLSLEIEPYIVPGVGVVVNDEYPRVTSMEKLSELKDVSRSGVVTPGNASGMGAASAAVILGTEEMAEKLGATVLAELVDFEFIGRNAVTMGLGPVKAAEELLKRNGLTMSQIGYTELNPAFSVQALACMKLLGLSVDDVNRNGDAISLSHPLAVTGVRQCGTAALEMSIDPSIKYALGTACVGGGMGVAFLLKR